jgi:AcrR family transcriptional regulator
MTKPIKSTPKNPELTNKMLLEAALKIFTCTSFKAAKLEDIAKEAGVTRGAISWHFKNKETIAQILLRQAFTEEFTDVSAIYESEKTPVEILENLTTYIVGDRESKRLKILLYNNISLEKPQGLIEVLDYIDKLFKKAFLLHSELIQKGIASGQLKQIPDTRFEARAFYTFLWGFFINQYRFFNGYTTSELEGLLKGYLIDRIVK